RPRPAGGAGRRLPSGLARALSAGPALTAVAGRIAEPAVAPGPTLALEDAAPAELGLEEHARELEVAVEGLLGLLRRVGAAGLEQLLVELAVLVLGLDGRCEQRRAVPLRAVPGGPDERDEPGRTGGVAQREMEGRVRA